MVGRFSLLMAAVLTALLVSSGTSEAYSAPTGYCPLWKQREGTCSTSSSSDGSGVSVIGTIGRDHNDSGAGSGGGKPGHALTDAELLALLDEICVGDGHCDARDGITLNPLLPPADPTALGAPDPAATISIRDLARFLPATAALHAEPDGWAVVGVPANFFLDVAPVTVEGSLLGETAQVRFTPRAFRFDYGDGTSRSTATGGSSWAALGQQELTETPTSHVYTGRGDRQASGTVVYSAAYRVAGGPWIDVAGAVSGTTPPHRVLVVVERTALTTPE